MSRNTGNPRLKAVHGGTGRQTKNLINNRATLYVDNNSQQCLNPCDAVGTTLCCLVAVILGLLDIYHQRGLLGLV
eukprot:scaffold62820_cov32-Attheya_sp.AAC.4